MNPVGGSPITKKYYPWLTLPTILIMFLTSGCVTDSSGNSQDGQTGSGADPEANSTESPEASGENEILASSTTSSTTEGADLQIDIYALERLENNLLRLRLGVINNSSDPYILGYSLSDSNSPHSASQVSLVDEVNQQRYLSYTIDNGLCFCNELTGAIPSGESADLWVAFPEPPDDLGSMTVTTPITPPLIDIPISNSSDSEEYSNLGEAQVLNLTTITDSLDNDQSGRTEDSDEVSILLSSDVLFETNKSELNNEAQEILEQVAQEVDDASASVVSIDGHADNTGDDSINVPLSEERAESVETALNDLVTRSGITFEVEGHGSSDPIADNETEEGRERNRRVSVTFEK